MDLETLAAEVRRLREEKAGYCARLAAERWIRVMCDYSADGVWARNGAATLPAFLPISIALTARILAWQEVYETFEPWEVEVDPVKWAAWAAEGLAIAIDMKRQLPDWTVVYHDDTRGPPQTPGVPWDEIIERYRPWFEHEIAPEVVRTGQPPDNYPK